MVNCVNKFYAEVNTLIILNLLCMKFWKQHCENKKIVEKNVVRIKRCSKNLVNSVMRHEDKTLCNSLL